MSRRRILERLPPEIVRTLARRRGWKGEGAEDADHERLVRWLLDEYVHDVSRGVSRTRDLIERARGVADRFRTGQPTVDRDDDGLDAMVVDDVGENVEGTPQEDDEEVDAQAPDTADLSGDDPDAPVDPVPTDPRMRTRTMAGVLESQGLVEEARAIYGELEKVPESHASGRPDAARSHRHPAPLADVEHLPERYGVDEIVILPVSPRSLYAYWELTPETQQRMRDAAGVEDASLVIHVQEIVTEEGEVVQHLARRIPVESPVGEYFIHEMTPGRLHVCMLGWAGPDGDFTAVVHSNPAPTPPDTPSSRLDERWTTLQPPTARETHAPATTVPAHPVDLDPLEIAMLRFHGRDATGIGLMDDHFAYRPEGSSDLSALAHVDREDRADPLPNGSADPPAADPEEPPL